MAYTNVCGKKLQSKMGGILNESATSHSPALLTSQQSFAKRQLEKMGWTEGTGLGKNRDGRKEHVKVQKREDNMGIGQEKELAKEMGNTWWKDSVGGTLARLQQKKKDEKEKKKRRKDKKKPKSSKSGESTTTIAIKTYTDAELFEATGGARFGMRAQRRAEGKWKRTESGSELMELEKKAKASMQWNGRGDAQVVIEEKSSKKRMHAEVDISTVTPSITEEERDDDEDDKQSKKKRRKLEKASKLHQVSLSASEEDSPIDKESKKKKKKEKKTKKSSKK
mmetsp:Transcript_441/g.978  ORF Transcript_441/g.978 Transcript_441/m.978 type:complete len:280 (-) Transcript_441:35-874(-)